MDVAPDYAAAAAVAKACRRTVEVLAQRSEFQQVFVDPAGLLSVEQSAAPQRVRTGAGGWAAVDLMLDSRGDGLFAPRSAIADVTFSDGGPGPFATLRTAKGTVSLGWQSDLPPAVLDGDSVVYRNVFPDVDLRVGALVDGFTHVLVVKTRAAAALPGLRQVRYGLSGAGLTPRSTVAGGLEMVDRTGVVATTASAPLMWDSRLPPSGSGAARVSAAAEEGVSTPAAPGSSARQRAVRLGHDEDELTLEPDAALLADPATVFPVFIDPDFSTGQSHWGYASQSGATRPTDVARVGLNDDGSGLYRSFFRFGVWGLHGKQVISAKVYSLLKHSWLCEATPISLYHSGGIPNTSKVPWGTALNARLATTSGHAHKGSDACGNQPDANLEFSSDGLKSLVQQHADNRWGEVTVGFVAHDSSGAGESTQANWKKLDPANTKLTVVYNTVPAMPDQLSVDNKGCATGSNRPFVSTATPTLRARATDADPDTLTVWFATAKWDGGRFVDVPGGGGSQGGVANGGTAQITPTLPGAGVYTFRALTADGYTAGPVTHPIGNCEFEVDLTDPVAPTVTGVVYRDGSAGCPAQGCGGVGQPDTFTFASSPDVAEFRWGFSDPPSTVVAPSALGSPVSVRWTPDTGGTRTMYVQAVDRAGRTATKVVQFGVSGPKPEVARWRLNEPAGTTVVADASGNGRTASVNGGTLGVAGRVVRGDSAARFTGATGGGVTGPNLLNTTKAFSVAGWVRVVDGGRDQAVIS